jgi:hypothetical protein
MFALWLARLLAAFVCIFTFAQAQAQVQEVRSGKFQFDDRDAPPEQITLPHLWDDTRPNYTGLGRYQFTLTALNPEVSNAVFIPRWMHNGEVWFNGSLLYRGGRFVEPVSRHFNRPVYAIIPSQLIRNFDSATLEVRVYGLRRFHSGMTQLYVGPQELLRPRYERLYLWNITGVQVALAVSIGVGLISLVYGLAMGYLPAFILFGLAALALGTRNYSLVVRDIPMPSDWWSAILFTGYGIFITCATLAGLRLADFRSRRVERAIWVAGLSFFFVPLAVFNDTLGGVLPVATALVTPMALLAGVAMFWIAAKKKAVSAMVLGAAMALYGATFMYDALFFLNKRPFDTIFVAHYVAIGAFSVVLIIIVRQHLSVLRRARTLAQNLEGEVARYVLQLNRRFDTLRLVELEAERSETKVLERARMIKEMNDTIGARLSVARAAIVGGGAQSDSLEGPVQAVLDELRLMIDSLDPQATDLLALLGNYRYRMERRLKALGLSLVWSIDTGVSGNGPFSQPLESGVLLRLARFVHECVEHAMQHPHYQQIVLSTALVQTSVDGETVDQLTLCLELKPEFARMRPRLPARLFERGNALNAQLLVREAPMARFITLEMLRQPT